MSSPVPSPTSLPLVSYHRHLTPDLPPMRAQMFEFIFAQNGIFLRAERPEMQVCLPANLRRVTAAMPAATPGPYPLSAYCRVALPPVSARLVGQIIAQAQVNHDADGMFREILFGLIPTPASGQQHAWILGYPEQIQTAGSVRPTDPYNPLITQAIIEIHSHHSMPAFFSRTDDADETAFKFYAVVGHLDSQPTIRLRLGVYGHHQDLRCTGILDLPPGVRDAVADAEADTEKCMSAQEALP